MGYLRMILYFGVRVIHTLNPKQIMELFITFWSVMSHQPLELIFPIIIPQHIITHRHLIVSVFVISSI